mgnify:FL=1
MQHERNNRLALFQRIAGEFGTPCYVYFEEDIRSRARDLRSAFDNKFQISFAVKSNPNVGLLKCLRSVVERLDVSSIGEIARALRAGWPPERLSFTGPGKSERELAAAVDHGVGEVVVESHALDGILQGRRRWQRVLLRISPRTVPPGFGLTMSGKPSAFGVDEEAADQALATLRGLSRLELVGFHIYSGSQCLKEQAIVENYRIYIEVFRRLSQEHHLRPRMLVFGAGLGVAYHPEDRPLDLLTVSRAILPRLTDFQQEFSDAELLLETGRYLVAEAGVYLTKVTRVKESRGALIAICDGGMHHNLAAAGHLGTVLRRNYRMLNVSGEQRDPRERGIYTIVGPLCTSLDTLGRDVDLARVEKGDVLAILCSGAYGLTASPFYFISHPPPREILVGERSHTCNEVTEWTPVSTPGD